MDSNWRWPVPFRTNDLRTAFWREGGQLLGCARASSSTGGRRMRGGEEKDREAGSHLLQRATTFPSSPRCLPCDSQAVRQSGRETEWDSSVFVWRMYMHSSLSSMPMTVCILHSSLFKSDNTTISNGKWKCWTMMKQHKNYIWNYIMPQVYARWVKKATLSRFSYIQYDFNECWHSFAVLKPSMCPSMKQKQAGCHNQALHLAFLKQIIGPLQLWTDSKIWMNVLQF